MLHHIHDKLRYHLTFYDHWHNVPFHPHIHWGILLAYLVGIATGVAVAVSGQLYQPVQAADVSASVTFPLSGSTVGAYVTAGQTLLTVTPAAALNEDDTITLTLPAGTSIDASAMTAADFAIIQAAPNQSGGCKAGKSTPPSSMTVDATTPSLSFTIASQSLSKGCGTSNGLGQLTVQLSADATGTELQLPTTATSSATVKVSTSRGDSGERADVSLLVGPALQLAFLNEPPQEATVGKDFTSDIEVVSVDQYGNVVRNFSGTVDLEPVEADAPGKTAPGKLAADRIPVNFNKGRAKFSKLSYDASGRVSFRAFGLGVKDALSRAVEVKPPASSSTGVSQTTSTTVRQTTPESAQAVTASEPAQPTASTPTPAPVPAPATPILLPELTITITDQAGQPVAGARVTIFSTPQTALTDQRGLARFAKVEPGEHTVVVEVGELRSETKVFVEAGERSVVRNVAFPAAELSAAGRQAVEQAAPPPPPAAELDMPGLLVDLIVLALVIVIPIVAVIGKR